MATLIPFHSAKWMIPMPPASMPMDNFSISEAGISFEINTLMSASDSGDGDRSSSCANDKNFCDRSWLLSLVAVDKVVKV